MNFMPSSVFSFFNPKSSDFLVDRQRSSSKTQYKLLVVDHLTPITGDKAKKVNLGEHLCFIHYLALKTGDNAKYTISMKTYKLMMFQSD